MRHSEKNNEKYIKKYNEIYKKYYRKCKTNINIERARLKRDSALFNVITVTLSFLAIYIPVAIFQFTKTVETFQFDKVGETFKLIKSSGISQSTELTLLIIIIGLVLLGAVAVVAAQIAAGNEFKLSVLDDILKDKDKTPSQ